jgi:hypothetical protein
MLSSREGEYAWYLHNQIVENEKQRRKLLVESIKYLLEIKESGLFKAILGDERASWSAYLTQNDTFGSRNVIAYYIRIYDTFVKKWGLDTESFMDIPYSKLYLIVQIATKENIFDWLEKARNLTTQDFEDELRIAKGKKSYLDCQHRFDEYEICSECGFRHKKEKCN